MHLMSVQYRVEFSKFSFGEMMDVRRIVHKTREMIKIVFRRRLFERFYDFRTASKTVVVEWWNGVPTCATVPIRNFSTENGDHTGLPCSPRVHRTLYRVTFSYFRESKLKARDFETSTK